MSTGRERARDNRHPREPNVSHTADDRLGFVVNVADPACRVEPDALYTLGEDVEPGSVRIQLKPHPGGYQIDMWWRTTDGSRRQVCEHLTFRDRRVVMQRERDAETSEARE